MPPVAGFIATAGGGAIASAAIGGLAAQGAARTQARAASRASQAALEAERQAGLLEQEDLTRALEAFEADTAGIDELFGDVNTFANRLLEISLDPSEDFGFKAAIEAGARDVNQTLAASGLFGSGANVQEQARNILRESGMARESALRAGQFAAGVAGQRAGALERRATTRADLLGRGAVQGGIGELRRQRDQERKRLEANQPKLPRFFAPLQRRTF